MPNEQAPARWSAWNARLAGVSWVRFVPLLVAGLAYGLLLAHAVATGQLNAPSSNPDVLDYQLIGHGIAVGKGFTRLTSDDVVFNRYPNADELRRTWPSEFRDQPTAMRPPVVPLLFAANERFGSGEFWSLRVVTIGFVAVSIGLAAWLVLQTAGPLPAVLFVVPLSVVFDWRFRETSRGLMTEAPAMFLVTLFAVLLLRLRTLPTCRGAIVAGVVLGLALLTRTMFVLWSPGIAVLLLVNFWTLGRRLAIRQATVVFLTTAAVFAPWAIRNVAVTGQFLPLGTQGQLELPAGFSDAAWAERGVWFNQRDRGDYDRFPPAEGIAWEVAAAEHGKTQVVSWVQEHPVRAVILGGLKIVAEVFSTGTNDIAVLLITLLGVLTLPRASITVVAVGLTCACLIAVAMTWSVGGRFLWPLLPVWHALATVGVWTTWVALTDQRSSVTATALTPTTRAH